MKKFLYLIQTRADFADRHLILKSERSDIFMLCFDKNLYIPEAIYQPDDKPSNMRVSWAKGRNTLVEAARKMKQKYEYYVLLDDDIDFAKGSFREFEDEVLNVKADICSPFYLNPGIPQLHAHAKTLPFRYSSFRHIDCCFLCFSQKIFLSPSALFPYHTAYDKAPFYHNSYYACDFFEDAIFALKHNSSIKPKILCLSRVWHTNLTNQDSTTNLKYRRAQLLKRIYGKRWQKINVYYRMLPFTKYHTNLEMMRYRRAQYKKFLSKIKQGKVNPTNITRKRYSRYSIKRNIFWALNFFLKKKGKITTTFGWVYLVGLYRDIKLNFSILRGMQHKKDIFT